MAKLITQLAAAGAISAPLRVETGSCVASDVAEMAPWSTVWGTCAPFPAIESRMCEMQA